MTTSNNAGNSAVDGTTADTPKPRSQVERIFAKFGGPRNLYRALLAINRRRNASTIYKWQYPRAHGGAAGVIPTSAINDVVLAARYEGIFLTPDDFYPGVK